MTRTALILRLVWGTLANVILMIMTGLMANPRLDPLLPDSVRISPDFCLLFRSAQTMEYIAIQIYIESAKSPCLSSGG